MKQLTQNKKIVIPTISLLLLGLLLSVLLINRQTMTRQEASNTDAVISLNKTQEITENIGVYDLNINGGDNKIHFIKVEIVYDPEVVQLADEVKMFDVFRNIIKVTDIVSANSSGRVVIMAGVLPKDKDKAPSGEIKIAQLKFRNITSTPTESVIMIDFNKSQVINNKAEKVNFNQVSKKLKIDKITPMKNNTSDYNELPRENLK